MTQSVLSHHIEITPGVCGGRPRIAGHRIRVQDIVVCHQHWGLSPEEIVAEYIGITLADVYAALAYYYDHESEIQQALADEAEVATRLETELGSVLKLRRGSRDGQRAPVSSR